MDCHIQYPFFRRHNNFTHFTVKFTVINGKCLHEKVGHILFGYGYFFNGTFTGHVDDFRRQINSVGRAHKQHHRSPCTVGIDLEPDTIPRSICTFIRNQFDFGKAIPGAIISFTTHREYVATFNGVVLFIGYPERQAILPGAGSLQLHLGLAPGIRIQLPAAHFSFLRLIIAVSDAQQP